LFYPATLVAATVIFVQPATAQMSLDPECVFNEGSQQSCSHVIGCIGGDTLFVGGSTGWESGRLEGGLYTGETCTGTWDNSTGMARFDCGGGLEGTVRYTLFDGESGTAIGTGEMLDGRPIDAWSGANILGYVQAETGRVTLQCGVQEIPLS
jgi:hypothetical protein